MQVNRFNIAAYIVDDLPSLRVSGIVMHHADFLICNVLPVCYKFSRRLVIQWRMESAHVVTLPPVINRFPGASNIAGSMLNERFISESSINTLSKSLLSWLTRQEKP